jgi:hypothetical protein
MVSKLMSMRNAVARFARDGEELDPSEHWYI